jgi:signal peptidase II
MRQQVLARTLVVMAIVIVADQVAKHTIGTSVHPGQVRHVFPGLSFVYARNTGVAFSALAGTGWLVYLVTIAALTALLTFLLARPDRKLLWLPTGMLVGGALSNLADRVFHGSVIDFIQLPHWPAFNIADMSITFGVIILVLVVEFGKRTDTT